MDEIKILWADDEIDLLKPHVLFLEQKGYSVETVNNGNDAVDMVSQSNFDIVFLDENMPGFSGVETLLQIKKKFPNLPVIMITKSEEEHIMEDAIGSNISDYLIKPVNPNQILLSLKKNLDQKRLQDEKTNIQYQQEFQAIGMEINDPLEFEGWTDLYKKLIYWELKLQQSDQEGMQDILNAQKNEAGKQFSKFIENHYESWMSFDQQTPLLTPNVLKKCVFPNLKKGKTNFLIVIDNLRYDQWKMLQPQIETMFRVEDEKMYCSILPTATQYARNSLFSGMMPLEMEKKHPKYWISESQEGGKNEFEAEWIKINLEKNGLGNLKTSYSKVIHVDYGKKLLDGFGNLLEYDLVVVVFNFVDLLSHARTDMKVVKELTTTESAYRSLTNSWFQHSPLKDFMKKISEKGLDVHLTTDHGTVHVDHPVKITGERSINSNLRYKVGKSMSYDSSEVFEIGDPASVHLPKEGLSSKFVFAKNRDFFAYPNNYNYYVQYYKDTFQHGGVSMEEMLIPYVHLSAK